MKRVISAVVVLIGLAAPAWAGFDGGVAGEEDAAPGGVGHSIIKGKGPLERIKRTEAEELAITAVRCLNAEEAEAMRQVYGDQPAQVLPIKEP